MVAQALAGFSLNQAEFIYLVLAVVFILGFFLDFIEICFIIIPLIMPLMARLRNSCSRRQSIHRCTACTQPADQLPHPTLRLQPLLPQRRSPRRNHNLGYLQRHHSLRAHPNLRDRDCMVPALVGVVAIGIVIFTVQNVWFY